MPKQHRIRHLSFAQWPWAVDYNITGTVQKRSDDIVVTTAIGIATIATAAAAAASPK
jgi:hypothetical protein